MAMTNIKEKPKTREIVSFKDQTINIGLDVHKKNWSVSIYLGDNFVKTFHQESSGDILYQHLKTNYPDGTYNACYEAGFCGFSVQRELTLSCSHEAVSATPRTQRMPPLVIDPRTLQRSATIPART